MTKTLNTVPTAAAFIEQANIPVYVETFIPTRYPYTYAYDFARSHAEIVPEVATAGTEEYWEGSRAQTAGVVTVWAQRAGYDREELIKSLADAYLIEHNVEKTDGSN